MNPLEEYERLFASPEYRAMLRRARDELARIDKESADLFINLANASQTDSEKSSNHAAEGQG